MRDRFYVVRNVMLVLVIGASCWPGCALRQLENHADPHKRMDAARALGQSPNERQVEALCAALVADRDLDVRRVAAEALWASDLPGGRACVLGELHNPANQCTVADFLWHHVDADPELAFELSPFATGRWNHECLVEYFVTLGDHAWPVLEQGLTSGDPERARAAASLGCRFGEAWLDELDRSFRASNDHSERITHVANALVTHVPDACARPVLDLVADLFAERATRPVAIAVMEGTDRKWDLLRELMNQPRECSNVDAAVLYYEAGEGLTSEIVQYLAPLFEEYAGKACPTVPTDQLVSFLSDEGLMLADRGTNVAQLDLLRRLGWTATHPADHVDAAILDREYRAAADLGEPGWLRIFSLFAADRLVPADEAGLLAEIRSTRTDLPAMDLGWYTAVTRADVRDSLFDAVTGRDAWNPRIRTPMLIAELTLCHTDDERSSSVVARFDDTDPADLQTLVEAYQDSVTPRLEARLLEAIYRVEGADGETFVELVDEILVQEQEDELVFQAALFLPTVDLPRSRTLLEDAIDHGELSKRHHALLASMYEVDERTAEKMLTRILSDLRSPDALLDLSTSLTQQLSFVPAYRCIQRRCELQVDRGAVLASQSAYREAGDQIRVIRAALTDRNQQITALVKLASNPAESRESRLPALAALRTIAGDLSFEGTTALQTLRDCAGKEDELDAEVRKTVSEMERGGRR